MREVRIGKEDKEEEQMELRRRKMAKGRIGEEEDNEEEQEMG